jgi:hypothetical protein
VGDEVHRVMRGVVCIIGAPPIIGPPGVIVIMGSGSIGSDSIKLFWAC